MNQEHEKNIRSKDYRYQFVNRMGGARINSIAPISENVYKVSISCNIYGFGAQTKVITVNEKGELIRLTDIT
jgi:hypothetical protein